MNPSKGKFKKLATCRYETNFHGPMEQDLMTQPSQPDTNNQGVEIEQDLNPVIALAAQIVVETKHEQQHFFKGDIQCARDTTLTPLQKTIYMILCTYRNNQTGEAWPSKNTVAEYAGCQPNAVRTACNALAERGYIKTERRYRNGQQTSNLITFPTLKRSTPKHTEATIGDITSTPVTQSTPTPAQPSTQTYKTKPTWQQQEDTRPKPQIYIPPTTTPKFDLAKHKIKQIRQQHEQRLQQLRHTEPDTPLALPAPVRQLQPA